MLPAECVPERENSGDQETLAILALDPGGLNATTGPGLSGRRVAIFRRDLAGGARLADRAEYVVRLQTIGLGQFLAALDRINSRRFLGFGDLFVECLALGDEVLQCAHVVIQNSLRVKLSKPNDVLKN